VTVAALYIDPRGPYPKLLGPDLCWDEQRDARTYAGPWPVVAHPPCGPWGRLKFLCSKQRAEHAPHAVELVREFGGVLEHPHGSQLWRHMGLPLASHGYATDEYGGRCYSMRQVAWGHRCEKPTVLYVVGVPRSVVLSGIRTGGIATRRVTNGSRGNTGLPRATNTENRRTPEAFARWLIALAEQAQPKA
jgi:hypothetical protein